MSSKSRPWWIDAVIYELYVDKFAKDFKGLTSKLDYFNYLGVNTLWILPHYPSPMIDGGYDVSDYKGIRQELGSMEDFDEFLHQAHQKNLKVVLDLILNHTSSKHPWFIEARSSQTSQKRDWFMWSSNTEKFSQAYVHFANVKNSNWVYNDATEDYYYATFYPQQPDLNWDNPEVYRAMLDVMNYWLSKGVDGFRLDAVSRLVKRENTNCFSLPETHEILKKIRSDISSKFPEAVLIAESGGWPNEAKTFFANGNECQLVINFPLAANILSAISDYDLSETDNVWQDSSEIPENCRWGIFLTNHDSVDLFFLNDERKTRLAKQNNLMARFGYEGGWGFAARLSELCQGDKDKILWAFKQMFRLPGVPILYYGNEIGMSNVQLPYLPTDYREYVRGNFDWEESKKQIKESDSILNGVRKMIQNR